MRNIPMALKGNTDIALLGLLAKGVQGALQEHCTPVNAWGFAMTSCNDCSAAVM